MPPKSKWEMVSGVIDSPTSKSSARTRSSQVDRIRGSRPGEGKEGEGERELGQRVTRNRDSAGRLWKIVELRREQRSD